MPDEQPDGKSDSLSTSRINNYCGTLDCMLEYITLLQFERTATAPVGIEKQMKQYHPT